MKYLLFPVMQSNPPMKLLATMPSAIARNGIYSSLFIMRTSGIMMVIYKGKGYMYVYKVSSFLPSKFCS